MLYPQANDNKPLWCGEQLYSIVRTIFTHVIYVYVVKTQPYLILVQCVSTINKYNCFLTRIASVLLV